MSTKPTNPFTYSADPELNRIFDSLIALRTRVANEFSKAEKLAGLGSQAQFMPLEQVTAVLVSYRDMRKPQTYGPKLSLADIDVKVQESINLYRDAIAATEAANRIAVDHNDSLTGQVTELMARLGITASYSTYDFPSSRSRTRKENKHRAGFLADLDRVRPTSNVESSKYNLGIYIRTYKEWVNSETETDRKEQIAADDLAVQQGIINKPELVEAMMKAGVNVLLEVSKAEPGKKREVIKYCRALAISNLYQQPNADPSLIDTIRYQ